MAFVGVNDRSLSERLMATIVSPVGSVRGLMGQGVTRELTANWDSPFEQDSAGGIYERTGGIAQIGSGELLSDSGSGLTSKSTMNSMQVWNGNHPHTFNLPLVFYALTDAYSEVQAAIIALEQMAAPEVSGYTPGGRIPGFVSLCVGRSILYPECHIELVSSDISGPKSRDGYPLRAEVTLTVQTKAMLNRSEIPSSFSS